MKIVRVVNMGLDPFKGKFDGEKFIIQSGSETLIPYGAMTLWLGDPNARDVDERNRHRTREFARLRVKYGAYDSEALWEKNRPQLVAYTLEGDEIPTVVADPEGVESVLDLGDETSESALRSELNGLREQMGQIQRMLEAGTLQVVAPTVVEEADAGDGNIPPPVVTIPEITVLPTSASNVEPASPAPAPPTTPPEDKPSRVRVGSRSGTK